jgi:hypothetical protein
MNLIFRWREVQGRPRASCVADIDLAGGFSPIARLLDCGVLGLGGGLNDWLREGISLAVAAEQLPLGAPPYGWSGSECCAEMGGELTSVSYLYDSLFEEKVLTSDFRLALEKWLDFQQSGPGSVVHQHMNVTL